MKIKASRGFAISFEALTSLFAFFLLLSAIPASNSQAQGLKELYLLQKSNDLLKVWALKHDFSTEELLSDLAFVFPENCVVLKQNKIPLNSCKATGAFITAKAGIFDSFLNLQEIELVVYY
ncbi:MAG: hypothetical protein Q7R70_06645 [Candidatus Diapherotrites archaeon]|nr:hypothetical protein [Candidatus Diapherotrites archaeon]